MVVFARYRQDGMRQRIRQGCARLAVGVRRAPCSTYEEKHLRAVDMRRGNGLICVDLFVGRDGESLCGFGFNISMRIARAEGRTRSSGFTARHPIGCERFAVFE